MVDLFSPSQPTDESDAVPTTCQRRAGVKSVAVRSQDYSDMQLIRPADDFYPMERYRKKICSPDDPKNKKLGHKRSCVGGVKGVIVPGDDGIMPFKLNRMEGLRTEKDTEHDVGSSDGEDKAGKGECAPA